MSARLPVLCDHMDSSVENLHYTASTPVCVHARLPAESIWIGMRKNRSVG